MKISSVLAVMLCAAASSLTASMITNASFETPSLGAGNFAYAPGGATWTFTGSSGIAANGSAFGFLPAPDGSQVAFLQGAVSFSETITSVTPGEVISFFAALRTTSQPGETFTVSYAGSVIGTFLASSLSTTWTQFSVSIPLAAPSSGLLQFASPGTGGDSDVGIDNVTSAAVPEPVSMQLFAIGLLSFSLMARKKFARK